MASAFRKIDIDLYDEDVLQESELYDADPRDASQALADAKQKQAAVRTLLARSVSINTAASCSEILQERRSRSPIYDPR